MINSPDNSVHFGSTDSVAGRFSYLWQESDAPVVLASGWTEDRDALLRLVHPQLRPDPEQIDAAGHPVIDRAVGRYSDGELSAIDTITARQRSGPFIESAWRALRETVAGSGASYTELAAHAGRPEAVRAAAAACACNAVALFVPCHRIVRRDGGLGGFRYGLPVKRTLRDHEARWS
jgi:methylated-DNA-[protein]-cysteine S-methyltransferase